MARPSIPNLNNHVFAIRPPTWPPSRIVRSTSRASTAAPPLLAVKCPGCERGLKAKSEMAGKTAKCPHCGHAVAVPNGVASKA